MTDRLISVGPTGAYTTLAAALAGEQGDISAATGTGERVRFQCGPFVDTAAATVSGWTADAGGYVQIEALPGAEAMVPMPMDGSRYLLQVASGIALTGSVAYTRLIAIAAENTDGTSTAVYLTGTASQVSRVWARSGVGRTWSTCPLSVSLSWGPTNPASVVEDCVLVNASVGTTFASNGLLLSGSQPIYARNCTVISVGGTAVSGNRTSHRVQNTVAYLTGGVGFANTGGGWDAASDYNASSDATAPGAHSLHSIADPFVDYAGGDYHLATGSALIGAGTDLSTYYTTDFDGDTIVNWSIGADDGPASGGGGPATEGYALCGVGAGLLELGSKGAAGGPASAVVSVAMPLGSKGAIGRTSAAVTHADLTFGAKGGLGLPVVELDAGAVSLGRKGGVGSGLAGARHALLGAAMKGGLGRTLLVAVPATLAPGQKAGATGEGFALLVALAAGLGAGQKSGQGRVTSVGLAASAASGSKTAAGVPLSGAAAAAQALGSKGSFGAADAEFVHVLEAAGAKGGQGAPLAFAIAIPLPRGVGATVFVLPDYFKLGDVRQAIEAWFEAGYSETPVAWPSQDFTPPDASDWVRFNLAWSPAIEDTVGEDGTNDVPGFVEVQLFAPAGRGAGPLMERANRIRALFDHAEIEGGVVRFGAAAGAQRARGGSGWAQVNVRIPFDVTETVIGAVASADFAWTPGEIDTPDAYRTTIERYFEAAWSDVIPIAWPQVETVPPDGDWVSIEVVFEAGAGDVMEDAPRNAVRGHVELHFHTKPGRGLGPLYAFIDEARYLFNRKALVGGIQFMAPSGPIETTKPGWRRMDVHAPFEVVEAIQ